MEHSRRRFLKIAGISALGIGTTPVLDVFGAAPEHDAEPEAEAHDGKAETGEHAAAEHGAGGEPEIVHGDEALLAKHWGMVVDTRKIESDADLEPLVEACHSVHNVPKLGNKRHEVKWLWWDEYKHVFPTMENQFLAERMEDLPFLALCNHCENPPCVRACPTKATFQRESDGLVLMDFHRCIGCRFCMAACPYGARSFNFRDPRPFIAETNLQFPTRSKGVVEKCNFCAERLAVGQMPACVEASNGILTFGDLDDPESSVRELLRSNFTIRRKLALGTSPSVYYIV